MKKGNEGKFLKLELTSREGVLKKLVVIAIVFVLAMTTLFFTTRKDSNVFKYIAKMAKEALINTEIDLTVTTNDAIDTANLSWKINSAGSFDYTIKRSVNSSAEEAFSQIFALPQSPIQVLNVSPRTKDSSDFALLKKWMDAYGQNLIEVTTVNIGEFSGENGDSSYKEQLKLIDGKYKYDLIVFGTADSNGSQDLTSDGAVTEVEKFIQAGHSVIFGHDTLAHSNCDTKDENKSGSLCHPRLNKLAKYAGIYFERNDWDGNGNHSTWVTIAKEGNVFTSYPYNIVESLKQIPNGYYPEDNQTKGLNIPESHVLGQYVKGTVWLKFAYQGTNGAANELTSGQNSYLTTYQCTDNDCKSGDKLPAPCAMIQTGHKNTSVTEDEEKIFANLIFYLWYQTNTNNNPNLEDKTYKDINKPDVPVLVGDVEKSISGVDSQENSKANVTIKATDNGTHYRYEVEAKDNVSGKIIKSNIEERTRITGVKKYQYFIDGAKDTSFANLQKCAEGVSEPTNCYMEIEVENDANTEKTISNITIGDKKTTYLHIRAVDKAENIGEQANILVHEDIAPKITIIDQTPTIWTNSEVTITAEATDEDGIVEKIEDSTGKTISARKIREAVNNTITMKETANGTYTITAIDNAGKKTTKEVTITNIDKIDPVITKITTTKNVDINGVKVAEVKAEIQDGTNNAKQSGIKNVVLQCNEIDKTLSSNNNTNDGVNRGAQSENVTFELTDADLNSGKCLLKVTDFAGNIGTKEITIESKVTVKFVDLEGKTIKNSIEKEGNVGTNYTLTKEELKINGYELVRSESPASDTGTYRLAEQEVTYVYQKVTSIKVNYVDINDQSEVYPSETKIEKQEEEYDIAAKNKEGYIVEGYCYGDATCTEEELIHEATVKAPITGSEITFFYAKVSEGLIVKYVDVVKDREIKKATKYTGGEGDIIQLSEIEIEGYELVEKPENNQVTLKEEVQEIILGYKKKITLKVLGKDSITGETLYEEKQEGLEGEEYQTTPQEDFENHEFYELTKEAENASGVYDREKTEVIYYYNRISAGVRVQYIDEETGTLLEETSISGYEGKEYQTDLKTFAKYDFVKVEGDVAGQMTVEEKVVKYYYTKKLGKIVIIYENASGEEISRTNYTGKVDESYNLELEHIYGYETIGVIEGSLSGSYLINDQVVRVLVEQLRSKITIKYVDEKGKELDREEYEDYVGNLLEMDLPKFKGYEIDGESNMSLEYIEEDQEITIKYKKNTQNPQTATSNIVSYAILGTISLMGMIITTKKKPKKD